MKSKNLQTPHLSPPPLEGDGGRLPIPVNIISGFLGSGKTTAIIRLLEQKPPDDCWAIVVNEFGKISIDGQTLQSKSISGSVFDISGGCICCSAKGYLRENLEKIIESGKFCRIIIEPSGLGGIEMVSEIVATVPKLELMPVICMVDITGLENPKLQRNLIYQSQIRMSQRIVFSKCDLLDSPEQQDERVIRFKSLFPEKYFCLVSSYLSPLLLSPSEGVNSSNNYTEKNYFPSHHLSDSNYMEHAFSFEDSCILNLEKLGEECRANQAIIRAKGHIQFPEGWRLFNYTLTGINIEPCTARRKNELIFIVEKSNANLFELERLIDSSKRIFP